MGRWGTAEVGVRDKYARKAVEGAIVDVALVALLLLVRATECDSVLRGAEGELDRAEALFNQSLHDRVRGAHHHLLLLLLLLLHHLGRGTVGMGRLPGAMRVSVRHGWRWRRGRKREE